MFIVVVKLQGVEQSDHERVSPGLTYPEDLRDNKREPNQH